VKKGSGCGKICLQVCFGEYFLTTVRKDVPKRMPQAALLLWLKSRKKG